MPTSLRARFALTVILGIFLIPISFSSLSGLTHIITCTEPESAPFSVTTDKSGKSVIASSSVLIRGAKPKLCGGLGLTIRVRSVRPGFVIVTMPIRNTSSYAWRGTVQLSIGGARVPISIGEIRPGTTKSSEIEVRVKRGQSKLEGRLLVGP